MSDVETFAAGLFAACVALALVGLAAVLWHALRDPPRPAVPRRPPPAPPRPVERWVAVLADGRRVPWTFDERAAPRDPAAYRAAVEAFRLALERTHGAPLRLLVSASARCWRCGGLCLGVCVAEVTDVR